jgi:UDP-N-acetylmuramate--alanine ligase
MNLEKIHRVYFIGIGGIGMSALARYMQFLGKEVAGYDRTGTLITDDLIDLGIEITFKDELDILKKDFVKKENTLIVYTPAVKRKENKLLNYFMSNEYNVIKRAALLGVITKNSVCLAVAGTHGKTTTSSILGHILKEAGVEATSFLGGIAENYNSNLILGGSKYAVVEADEFDRSFLQLEPNIACITSVDADHLDIYNSHSDLVDTFKEFGALASEQLFVKKGLPFKATTYGVNEDADFDAHNIRIDNGVCLFDVKTPKQVYKNIEIQLAGKHNVLNTMAALAMANSIGVSLQDIAKALLTYKGVNRRFSYRLKSEKWILIDDYAHHPTEINAVFDTVNEMYPKEKKLAIFQPHLYSRTRDFVSDFVKSLAQFDQIILLPIYAAREHPINGVSSQILVEKIKKINTNVSLVKPESLFNEILNSNTRLVIMMGAGDIGEMVTDVQEKLSQLM